MNLMKLDFVVRIILVIVCSATFGSSLRKQHLDFLDENDKAHKNTSWNYLVFVNQWPQSFCMYYNATHQRDMSTHCLIPQYVNNWTIHGMWPTISSSKWPMNCNNSWPFNISKIKDLVPELKKLWPDLLMGSFPLDHFWAHEWTKHGTCAASLPALSGEHNYFGGTLKLREQFNIDSILDKAGITPSPKAKYSLSKLRDALKMGVGAIPNFFCFDNNTDQYLAEIRMCLNKNLQPFDCHSALPSLDQNSDDYSPCSSKTNITLPPITH